MKIPRTTTTFLQLQVVVVLVVVAVLASFGSNATGFGACEEDSKIFACGNIQASNSTGDELQALDDRCMTLKQRVDGDLDVISNDNWNEERNLTADTAAAPPELGNQHDTSTADFELTVERQEKFELVSATDEQTIGLLHPEDEAVVLHRWMSEQVDFFRRAGRFHTDGHLLLQKDLDTFVWDDYGSFPEHPEQQFCTAVKKVSEYFVRSKSTAIKEIAQELPKKHCGNRTLDSCCVWANKYEDKDIVAHFEDLLTRLENSDAVDARLWRRRGGRRMGARVGRLEERVGRLEERVGRLEEDVAQMQKDVAQLQKDFAQMKEIVAQLHERVARLEERNEFDELIEQTANLSFRVWKKVKKVFPNLPARFQLERPRRSSQRRISYG